MTTTTLLPNTGTISRLAVVRRVYVYGVLLISFIVGLAAVDALLATLADIWLAPLALFTIDDDGFARDAIARSGGTLLIATLVFVLHWAIAHHDVNEATGKSERESLPRKLFLYIASGVSLGYAVYHGYDLLRGLGRLALGVGAADTNIILPSAWLNLSLVAIVGIGLLMFWQRTLASDGDYGCERRWPGVVRRLYQAIVGLAGLLIILFGSARLVQTLLETLLAQLGEIAGPGFWRLELADGFAGLLIGVVLVRALSQGWQGVIDAHPAEGQAALRRVYLYLAIAIGALATLIPAALALNEILLLLFNLGGDGDFSLMQRLEDFVQPASFVPAGLLVWIGYRRYLHGELARYGESSESATIRRIYNYIVAAVGLALLWVGVVLVLQAGLDRLLFAQDDPFWINPLAGGLSALLIGAPIWSLHWRTIQSRARQGDIVGARERAAWPRKIFLYGVALVGALLILFDVAQVLYRLLLFLLGEPDPGLLGPETIESLVRSGVALAIWSAHLLVLRRDSRLGTELVDEEDEVEQRERRRAELIAQIERLEGELAVARVELEELG